MRQFADKILAAVVAISFNVAAIWFLASEMQRSRYAEGVGVNSAIQVVWIRRPSVAKRDQPQPVVVGFIKRRAGAASSKRPSTQRSQNLTVVDVSPTKTSTTTLQVAGDDHWDPETFPMKGRFPAAGPLFLRNPLARHPEPLEATQNRMNLAFRDRSFGGALQRMSRKNMCGDLRHALATDSTSAESILRTMKKYGCIR